MRECAVTLSAEMRPEEHLFLLDLIRRENKQGKHLEIGTAAGGTLCEMMGCFAEESRPPFVVVDPMKYFPDQLATVKKNLAAHGVDASGVEFREKTSVDAFAEAAARGESFDFMLIDGSHKLLPVTRDLRWTRLLAVGGVVCLHDYHPQFQGVFRAANNFIATHRNFEKIGLGSTILALRKISAAPRPEVRLANWLHAWWWYTPLEIQHKLMRARENRTAAAV